MPLQPFTSAPQPTVAIRDKDAPQVGYGYMGTYNEAQMAKYNNEYNYWLWQQQAEYNSPSEQMKRAREAGLNPNVVAGNVSSGNLSSIPSSQARISSNPEANQMQLVNLGVNSFNSLLKAIGEGIEATSKISGIPQDIGSYRNALNEALTNSNESKLINNILNSVDIAKYTYLSGVANDRAGYTGAPDWMLQYDGKNKDGLHLYSIRQSALTKMWDEEAKTPQIVNLLKNSAIKKNFSDIDLQEANKLLIQAKTKLTNEQYDMFKAQVVSGIILKALGIAPNFYSNH